MSKKLLTLVIMMGLLVSGSAAAAVYVYTDASGTHYTDKPVDGAKRVHLPQAQTYSPGNTPPASAVNKDRSSQSDNGDKTHYQQVSVTSPHPDQTFRSAERLVPVKVSVKPGLRSKDRIMIYHNGQKALPAPTRAMSLTLKVSGRGAQNVSAAVVGPNGKRIASSTPVSFFMKPPTVNRAGAATTQ